MTQKSENELGRRQEERIQLELFISKLHSKQDFECGEMNGTIGERQ